MEQERGWKKALRWTWYVVLVLVAAGAVEKGPAEAVGVLCIIVVWATIKLARGLADVRAAIERTGASNRAEITR